MTPQKGVKKPEKAAHPVEVSQTSRSIGPPKIRSQAPKGGCRDGAYLTEYQGEPASGDSAPQIIEAAVAYSRLQRVLLVCVPPLATALLRLLCLTLRFEDRAGPGARPADRHQGQEIYAFWHRSLLLAAYRYRNLGIFILISASFDGELIARVVQRLGFVPVRGSSSRGGAAGLLQMDRRLREGGRCAVTADGPRGPVYVAKPGVTAMAQRDARRRQGSSEVSCFHIDPRRAWTLRSWDRFLIPKPFSRVVCAWPAPVQVSAAEPAEAAQARVQATLDMAVAMAESQIWRPAEAAAP